MTNLVFHPIAIILMTWILNVFRLNIKMGVVRNLLLLMCSPLPLVWWLRILTVEATSVNPASNLVKISDPIPERGLLFATQKSIVRTVSR